MGAEAAPVRLEARVLYLVAIVLPPLAMFLVGKPFQAILCFLLQITLIGWAPAAVWALFVVRGTKQGQRRRR